MWVFTTDGFFSVVAHRARPGFVLVRARAREDLEALAHRIPRLVMEEDVDADYRWRAVVSRAEWQNALAGMAGKIDYDNFKNAVADRAGARRAALYGEVWSLMRPLHDEHR